MKKVGRIILTVLGAIVALILLLYGVLWIVRSAMYSESMKLRQYVCDVPEVNSGYAPQGITYAKTADGKDVFLMTGYDGNDKTVLYVSENNVPRRVRVLDKYGNDLSGHAGGIACTKDYVYIANGGYLHVYSLYEIVNATDAPVELKLDIPVCTNAAFVFSDDNSLYVGEFYRPGNYETDPSHHYTTPNGDENKAIVACYDLNLLGLVSGIYPKYCISVTGLVQGFAVKDGVYMLSRSWGLSNSSLEYYSEIKSSGTTIKISATDNPLGIGVDIPLYYLDSSNLTKTVTLPAFSEDLTIFNDRVVVTNESACNKYFVGKLFGGWKVYSYPITFED